MDNNRAWQREIQWADGLRGIAPVFVVVSHCQLAFAYHYTSPVNSDGTLHLFQLPFLRIVGTGHTCVAIFFLLSGFVCALKPLRLARSRKAEEVRECIASSTFRRVFRLVIPCTIATVLAWILAQWNAFQLASNVGHPWLHDTAPQRDSDLLTAISKLFKSCLRTWSDGQNEYDRNQWTMGLEMRGSMLLYISLFATANFSIQWRGTSLFALATYFYLTGDVSVGPAFFVGALFADLSLFLDVIIISPSSSPRRLARAPKLLTNPTPLIPAVLGVYLGSFPTQDASRAAWSNSLHQMGLNVFPAGCEIARGWALVSSILIVISILFSPTVRRLLSHRFLVFLGSISFPMYLLHGTLIRSILTWGLYVLLPAPKQEIISHHNGDGELVTITIQPPVPIIWQFVHLLVWVTWTLVLVGLSVLWRNKVDLISVQLAKNLEEVMMGKKSFFRSGQGNSFDKTGVAAEPMDFLGDEEFSF